MLTCALIFNIIIIIFPDHQKDDISPTSWPSQTWWWKSCVLMSQC